MAAPEGAYTSWEKGVPPFKGRQKDYVMVFIIFVLFAEVKMFAEAPLFSQKNDLR